jgi:serine/threonine protein kinase
LIPLLRHFSHTRRGTDSHKPPIAHRDIKPASQYHISLSAPCATSQSCLTRARLSADILVGEGFVIKLGDFGESKDVSQDTMTVVGCVRHNF